MSRRTQKTFDSKCRLTRTGSWKEGNKTWLGRETESCLSSPVPSPSRDLSPPWALLSQSCLILSLQLGGRVPVRHLPLTSQQGECEWGKQEDRGLPQWNNSAQSHYSDLRSLPPAQNCLPEKSRIRLKSPPWLGGAVFLPCPPLKRVTSASEDAGG